MVNTMARLLMILTCFTIFLGESLAGVPTYNVVSLGAKPDGRTDSTMSFMSAWASACGSAVPAVIYVPQGSYLVGGARFEGKCNNSGITLHIDGTLVQPSNFADGDTWLQFHGVDGLTISGGTLDGQGARLWACKTSAARCPLGATNLKLANSNNIKVDGLTSLNSQMFHIVVNGCENVKFQGVNISAPGNSPNTDGIHIQLSSYVSITNSQISTGDDCISMGPGTTNVWIEQINCGPGHGISIGSLGLSVQEAGVQNVTANAVTFSSTQNGFRIKTWGKPSTSFVKDVHFQNSIMVDVQNPVLIDQNYCPTHRNCPGQFSGVKISDVTYLGIHGTSASQVAMKLDCSKKNPCTGITLDDVKLTYTKEEAAIASCTNAGGTNVGVVVPSGCL